MAMICHFEKLPLDVIYEMLGYLSVVDIVRCRQVCTPFLGSVNHRVLTLWDKRCAENCVKQAINGVSGFVPTKIRTPSYAVTQFPLYARMS